MTSRCLLAFVMVFSFGRLAPVAAQARDVNRILQEMEDRHRSTGLEYVGDVVVTSKSGAERRKSWITFREGSGRTANRLIRFLGPADVRGVAFLSLGRAGGSPDQWMYLPSMKRERRLAPQDRDASFVGTDFSYADLDEFDRTDYTATLEPDQMVDGELCFTVRLIPRARSPFTHKILTVSQSRFVPRRTSYFRDGRSTAVKVLSFFDYQPIGGHFVALRVEMADAVKGSRTVIRLTDVQFDQPQPRDRYTLQNLVREGADLPAAPRSRPSSPNQPGGARWQQSAPPTDAQTRSTAWLSGVSGVFETRALVFPKGRSAVDGRVIGGTRVDLRQQTGRGRVRFATAVRAEAESGGLLGDVTWDPADRLPRRSPLSLRELSFAATLARALDLTVGRFEVTWGSTDTLSPASAFLPEDLTDPLAWQHLPLWGARLTGQRGRVRVDVYKAFTTTPWRVPRMDGRFSPGAHSNLYFVGAAEEPPTRGFEVVRVTGLGSGWDVTGWVRTGVRPAPLFSMDIDATEEGPDGRFVNMRRRFASERAAGFEITRPAGSWLLRGEASVTHSDDADLGTAYFYTLQAEHAWRAGLITASYAGRAPDTGLSASVPFDRAGMPSVTLAMTQAESWGDWRASWFGTIENVGGLFSGEITRPLDDAWRLVIGVDVPHGSSFSAMGAFASARRLRTSLRFTW